MTSRTRKTNDQADKANTVSNSTPTGDSDVKKNSKLEQTKANVATVTTGEDVEIVKTDKADKEAQAAAKKAAAEQKKAEKAAAAAKAKEERAAKAAKAKAEKEALKAKKAEERAAKAAERAAAKAAKETGPKRVVPMTLKKARKNLGFDLQEWSKAFVEAFGVPPVVTHNGYGLGASRNQDDYLICRVKCPGCGEWFADGVSVVQPDGSVVDTPLYCPHCESVHPRDGFSIDLDALALYDQMRESRMGLDSREAGLKAYPTEAEKAAAAQAEQPEETPEEDDDGGSPEAFVIADEEE